MRKVKRQDAVFLRPGVPGVQPKQAPLPCRFFAAVFSPSVDYIEEFFGVDGRVEDMVARKKGDMQQRVASAGMIFEMWYSHAKKRSYLNYEMCVDPAKENPRKYNLFTGKFPFEHLQPPYELNEEELALIEPILAHYEKVFGEGDPEGLVYLWDWFALPLQQVGTKTCVAIVIRVRFISVPIDGQPDTEHADSASLSSVLPEASLSECLVYHVQDEGQGCGHSVEDEQTGGGDTGL